MKTESQDWLDWLHQMRREEEEKRIRDGVSMTEWLKRVNAEARTIRSRARLKEQPPVARDE